MGHSISWRWPIGSEPAVGLSVGEELDASGGELAEAGVVGFAELA